MGFSDEIAELEKSEGGARNEANFWLAKTVAVLLDSENDFKQASVRLRSHIESLQDPRQRTALLYTLGYASDRRSITSRIDDLIGSGENVGGTSNSHIAALRKRAIAALERKVNPDGDADQEAKRISQAFRIAMSPENMDYVESQRRKWVEAHREDLQEELDRMLRSTVSGIYGPGSAAAWVPPELKKSLKAFESINVALISLNEEVKRYSSLTGELINLLRDMNQTSANLAAEVEGLKAKIAPRLSDIEPIDIGQLTEE